MKSEVWWNINLSQKHQGRRFTLTAAPCAALASEEPDLDLILCKAAKHYLPNLIEPSNPCVLQAH